MRWTKLLVLALLLSTATANAQRSLRKANKQYDLHAYNLAIEEYLRTIEKRPDNAEALWKLGNSYRLLNNMQEAALYFERAVRQRNTDPVAYLLYGHTLRALGRYDEALLQYRQFERTDPVVGMHYAGVAEFAQQKSTEPPSYSVRSAYVNTTAADFAAVHYGVKTVFSSSRTDIRPRSGQPLDADVNNRLFVTDADKNGNLKPPTLLREGLVAGRGNEAPVAYSPDGRYVAITRNNFVDGTRQIPEAGIELSLYIAEVTEAGNWSSAQAFPFNGSGFSTGYGSFSPDGRALYFASDRPDGFGGFDVYVSYRVGTSWSTPENLGAVVNSQGNEISPYFDGSTLYFSSDWHPGLGGFDVFRAERSNERWTSIDHLGTGVNSTRDDLYYSFDNLNNQGYVTSNRPGRGQEDIFRVSKSRDQLNVVVLDAATRRPIPGAQVDLSSCGDRIYQTDQSGSFKLPLRAQLNCTPIVRMNGYASSSFALNSATALPNQRREILLQKTGDRFQGRVTDVSSGLRLDNVRIRATDQRTGTSVEAFSNSGGEYTLDLKPNTTYLVRYARSGYMDNTRTVRTGAAPDANLLAVTSLQRSIGQIATPPVVTRPTTPSRPTPAPPVVTNPPTSTGGSVGYPSSPNTGSTPSRPTTTYPAPPLVVNQDPPTVSITSGYAVQFLATGKRPDMGRFQAELGSLGDVYYRTANGINKVRVGVYATRTDAERIREAVRRAGYAEAFIVDEAQSSGTVYSGGGIGSDPGYTGTVPGVVGQPRPNSGVVYPGTNSSTGASGGYLIKLGVYRNAGSFDRDRVMQMGYLEERKRGDLTVFLLSGYATVEDARRGLRSAKGAGFSDAYIVEEVNGTFRTVK